LGKTTGTFFAFAEGFVKGIRGTFTSDGDFVRTSGVAPLFNPATATYATGDMVANLVAASAATEHPIVIRGDEVSAARLLGQTHTWKQFLSFEDACAHKYLGKTMDKAVILARYEARIAEVDGLEG